VTSLLTSNLKGLGEVAIWAPTGDTPRRDWEYDYPLELIKELCDLCKRKELHRVQILFTDAGGAIDYPWVDTLKNYLAKEENLVEFKLFLDVLATQKAERHWGISVIKAVLSLEAAELEVKGVANSLTTD
jgi:hypothetical protein